MLECVGVTVCVGPKTLNCNWKFQSTHRDCVCRAFAAPALASPVTGLDRLRTEGNSLKETLCSIFFILRV